MQHQRNHTTLARRSRRSSIPDARLSPADMTETQWQAEIAAIKSPRGRLMGASFGDSFKADSLSSSIFLDGRHPMQLPRRATPAFGASNVVALRAPAAKPFSSNPLAMQTTKVFKSGIVGPACAGPERLDVHHAYHVGGSAGLVAAGVRTQTSTPASTPWTVQTGKPSGGWSVAGMCAAGW